MKPVSTKKVDNTNIFEEIKNAISNIKWGSIEIFIQDSSVVQITERNIKKMQESKKS